MTSTTSKLGADMQDERIEAVAKALRRAWQLGQTYWQHAGSDSWKQQAKCAATQKTFKALVDETRALLARQPAAIDADAEEMRDAAMRTVQASGLVYTKGAGRWKHAALDKGSIYQAWIGSAWVDVTEEQYDGTQTYNRRTVYADPPANEARKPAPSVKVYPQGVMGIPPYSPPGSGSMTVKPGISHNAAPSAEQDERGGWDGDSEESRTAFRDCDSTAEPISLKTPWQIWRSACAWQARAASTTAVAQDESEAFRAWYSTHKVTGDVAEAAWMARAASTPADVAQDDWPVVMAAVQDANGHVVSATLQVGEMITRLGPVPDNVAQGADPSDAQIESLCESHGLGPSVGKLVVKDALKRWGSIEPAQPALTDDARDAFILDIAAQTPEKPDYWSSCGQCEHNIERAQDLLDAAQSASESEGK